MKTTIDYGKSPAPMTDAVADVMEYFGDRYDTVAGMMKEIKDCRTFKFYCGLAGIEGLPVKAWYEHFHGGGTWCDNAPHGGGEG